MQHLQANKMHGRPCRRAFQYNVCDIILLYLSGEYQYLFRALKHSLTLIRHEEALRFLNVQKNHLCTSVAVHSSVNNVLNRSKFICSLFQVFFPLNIKAQNIIEVLDVSIKLTKLLCIFSHTFVLTLRHPYTRYFAQRENLH